MKVHAAKHPWKPKFRKLGAGYAMCRSDWIAIVHDYWAKVTCKRCLKKRKVAG